jgi:hypothetical protein
MECEPPIGESVTDSRLLVWSANGNKSSSGYLATFDV